MACGSTSYRKSQPLIRSFDWYCLLTALLKCVSVESIFTTIFRLRRADKVHLRSVSTRHPKNLNMKCLLKCFAFFILIAAACAQHHSDKPCPVRPIVQNFDIKKVSLPAAFVGRADKKITIFQYTSGIWYDTLRYEARFSKGCDCGFANYDLKDDLSVGVQNCCKRLPNTTLSCVTGQAKLSEPDHVPLEGKINVSFGKRREFAPIASRYQQ